MEELRGMSAACEVPLEGLIMLNAREDLAATGHMRKKGLDL